MAQYKKEEVRGNIIEASKALFTEKGVEKTSLKDISKRSNASIGNIYRYFKNKEEIVMAVIEPVLMIFDGFFKEIQLKAVVDDTVRLGEKFFYEKRAIVIGQTAELIIEVLFKNHREILILFMSEVDRIDFEGISFIEFVKATFLQLGYIKGELLAYAYAKSLIHGVEILIRECNDIEAFRVNLEGYFDLYFSDKQ